MNDSMKEHHNIPARLFAAICVSFMFISAFSMHAFADTVKNYNISGVSLADNEDGIFADWDKAQSSTKYSVTLYRDSMYSERQKVKKETVSTNKVDFTKEILDKGTGYYYISVHPLKADPEYIVWSDKITVDKDIIKYYTDLSKKEEKETGSSEVSENGKSYLEKVDLTISVTKNMGGKINNIGRIASTGASSTDITYDIPFENWTLDSIVTVSAKLRPATGKAFGKQTIFTCDRTSEFSYEVIDENNAKIVFKYHPRMVLQAPAGIRTKDNEKFLWNSVPHAEKYKITVYLNSGKKETYHTASPVFDITKYGFSEDDIDHIEIQSIANDLADNIFSSATAVFDGLFLFSEDCRYEGRFFEGSGSIKYTDENNNTVTGWKEIASEWYYFTPNGYAYTGGWLEPGDGKMYYINETGQMLKGEIIIDGKRYQLDQTTGARIN